MSNPIFIIIVMAVLMYGGWYWYTLQPTSYSMIVPFTDANKSLRYVEDACEGALTEAQQSYPSLACELTDARRVDNDVTEVDIWCKGKNTAGGCYICAIACK